jgi:hypothetical protein
MNSAAAPTISAIVNADIASGAAIALSKLATGALPAAITVADANMVSVAGTKVSPNFGAQNVVTTGDGAFGTASPDANAALTVTSTTKGFLPPRMTGTQRDAISAPPAGLMIYNSTTNKLQVRTNAAWVDLH